MDKLSVFSKKLGTLVPVLAGAGAAGDTIGGTVMDENPSIMFASSWSNGGWNNSSYSDWLNGGWNNSSYSSWQNGGWNNASYSSWSNGGWNNSSSWSNGGWSNSGGK